MDFDGRIIACTSLETLSESVEGRVCWPGFTRIFTSKTPMLVSVLRISTDLNVVCSEKKRTNVSSVHGESAASSSDFFGGVMAGYR